MGGLFNLAKALVSALHIELKYKVEKLKYKKLEVTKPRIKKIPNFQLVNKPSRVFSSRRVLHSWWINTVYQGGGLMLTFFPWKGGGAYLSCWGQTRGFTVSQIRGNLSKFHGERRYVTNLRMLVSESSTKKDCRSFSVQWAVLGRFYEEISSHWIFTGPI